MTSSSKPPAPKRSPDTLPPYDALDPIPQPEVSEKSSDTMWQLWNDVSDKEQARYADTVPITVPGAQATSPQPDSRPPGAPLRPAPSSGTSGLEKLIEESRRNNRVCPRLPQWQALDAALRASAPASSHAQPLAPPLPERDWKTTTPLAKRLMFRSLIDWCARYGLVEPALQFVRALPEDQWHHMGD